ncbi:hypothetical protein, conserved [Babesia bigemina]|uniref:Thioredoxin domain-containing protein n=1 Tax=Babesia bigemina TaxID=5866 RepID=A0A061D8W0_BABBI|nr:hypothetical protein, conserved [Babesia bigemina]CDR94180.1 hypothetical protein, conserved [Babesia bigemina]|eukprot:XP_012766366.1 hypothetical protein, conserved [Babesia bigemina]
MVLHFYSGYSSSMEPTCGLQKVFTSDPTTRKIIIDNNINCYTQDVCYAQPELIDRLEITTVPVIVGVYRGRKVAEVNSDNVTSCGSELCRKLVEASSSTSPDSRISDEKELEERINALVSDKSCEEAHRALDEFANAHIQRLEVDDILRQLLARARLQLYHSNFNRSAGNGVRLSVDILRDQLKEIEQLISDLRKTHVEDLIASFPSDGRVNPQPYGGGKTNMAVGSHCSGIKVAYIMPHRDAQDTNNHCNDSGTMAEKRLEGFLAECSFSDIVNKSMFQDVTLAQLIKVELLKRISIVLFLDGNVDVAMEEAVRAYEELVKILKSDSIPVQVFESHEIGSVIECMLSALPWRHPAVLGARAALETMDGPRLLNRMRQSNRPLGGPVSKRRGFGGRYVWHGPDYRPKKYRPRDPEQYLNEWRYQADSNLPTF